ncbi:MAG TPA: Asd/ArgC dimerization domain-containing protein [Vulgatibacter sp.]|nr:Asd/ArgC dimerization domain-containing protein [Vulgatibacter sp.]
MASRTLKVAIVGAATAVGRELGPALSERSFPMELRLFGGEEDGDTIEIDGEEAPIARLENGSLRGFDLVFVPPGAGAPAEALQIGRDGGAVVIDAEGAPGGEGPVIFPGINDEELEEMESARGRTLRIPSATAAQLAKVLLPLQVKSGITNAQVVCLEAVSSAGIPGMEELSMQTISLLNGRDPELGGLPHRIAFNAIPAVDGFGSGGDTLREERVAAEVVALLGREAPALSITCVWVPVFYGSMQLLTLASDRPLDAPGAREAFGGDVEVKVLDDPSIGVYPMPMLAVGDEAIQVGRVRATPAGLSLLSVADGLRWGTVLPMVRLAELLREGELV